MKIEKKKNLININVKNKNSSKKLITKNNVGDIKKKS